MISFAKMLMLVLSWCERSKEKQDVENTCFKEQYTLIWGCAPKSIRTL